MNNGSLPQRNETFSEVGSSASIGLFGSIRLAEGSVMCLGNLLLAVIILKHKQLRRKEMMPIAGLAIGDAIYGEGQSLEWYIGYGDFKAYGISVSIGYPGLRAPFKYDGSCRLHSSSLNKIISHGQIWNMPMKSRVVRIYIFRRDILKPVNRKTPVPNIALVLLSHQISHKLHPPLEFQTQSTFCLEFVTEY